MKNLSSISKICLLILTGFNMVSLAAGKGGTTYDLVIRNYSWGEPTPIFTNVKLDPATFTTTINASKKIDPGAKDGFADTKFNVEFFNSGESLKFTIKSAKTGANASCDFGITFNNGNAELLTPTAVGTAQCSTNWLKKNETAIFRFGD